MLHDVPTFMNNLPDEYLEIKDKILRKYCNEKSKIVFLLSYRINYGLSKSDVEKYMNHFSGFEITKAKLVAKLPTMTARFILKLIHIFKNSIKWVLQT